MNDTTNYTIGHVQTGAFSVGGVAQNEGAVSNSSNWHLYFEAHVTIEPLFDERLAAFTELADQYGFRVADLLMKKRPGDEPERSQYDSFCTGRSKNYTDLADRMTKLVRDLQQAGVKVWRYKIEETLLDSAISDDLELLD